MCGALFLHTHKWNAKHFQILYFQKIEANQNGGEIERVRENWRAQDCTLIHTRNEINGFFFDEMRIARFYWYNGLLIFHLASQPSFAPINVEKTNRELSFYPISAKICIEFDISYKFTITHTCNAVPQQKSTEIGLKPKIEKSINRISLDLDVYNMRYWMGLCLFVA